MISSYAGEGGRLVLLEQPADATLKGVVWIDLFEPTAEEEATELIIALPPFQSIALRPLVAVVSAACRLNCK